MSLEDKARQIQQQVQAIRQELLMIGSLCYMATLEFLVGDTVVTLPTNLKAKLIEEYQRRRDKVKQLVEALP